MSLWEAFLLGLFQGITEFLPVSSSGHLVLAEYYLGLEATKLLAFDAVLHGGTLLSLLVVFRSEMKRLILVMLRPTTAQSMDKKLFWGLIVATIPAAACGFLFEDFFETFRDPFFVAVFFAVSAILFFLAEKFPRAKNQTLTWKAMLLGGLFQVASLLPGISRSGSVMAAAMLGGTSREEATRFSFLLGIPIIAGAFLLSLGKNYSVLAVSPVAAVTGFIVSAAIGFLMIKFLLRFFQNHTLYFFGVYLLIAAAAVVYTT